MKRREFITLLGGAAAAWPLAVRAQQPDRVRRIGVFAFGAESDPVAQAYVRALRQGLEQLGWIEGRNIRVDYRWASGDRLKAEVAEMVELAPDVILCGATQLTGEFQQKTRTIPIVFVHVADPVAGGLVGSLPRPGGNITGFTAYESSIGEKWLEVLKEIAPRLTQVAVLVDPQNPTWMMHVPTMEKAAPLFAVQLAAVHVRDAAEIERSINSFAARPNTGLIVLPSVMNSDQRELITILAAKHRMPAIYALRAFFASGGLAYYKTWLEQQLARVSMKSVIAEVIRYGLNHWDGLVRFLDDGRIELDTNIVERSIRPIVLNRKNALFAGHDQGAENWAAIASLVETCTLYGVDPQAYFADVLTKLVNLWPASRLDELMPWGWAAQRSADRLAA